MIYTLYNKKSLDTLRVSGKNLRIFWRLYYASSGNRDEAENIYLASELYLKNDETLLYHLLFYICLRNKSDCPQLLNQIHLIILSPYRREVIDKVLQHYTVIYTVSQLEMYTAYPH